MGDYFIHVYAVVLMVIRELHTVDRDGLDFNMVFEFYISWTLWGVFLFVFALTKLIEELRKNVRLPPGPWGLPFAGYLPFLRPDTHVHFKELAEKYGSVFSTRLGNKLIVVLSDYRMIREAFSKEEFTGRPDTEFSNILGGYGVVNSDGRLWKDQRRFLHEKLKHFGVTYAGAGKEQIQSKIMQEVVLFLQTLNDHKESSVDLEPLLALSISNVICSIVMSVRFQQKDPRFMRFTHLIAEGFRLFARMTYVNFIPVLRYLPGLQETRKQIAHNRSEMAEFFQQTVDDHRQTFDPCYMRDMIDNYLLVIQEAQAKGRESELFEGKNHDRQIQQIIGDLFSAGMETIKTTIQWAVVFMLHHPNVAAKIQEELDKVVGRKRLPGLKDRPCLPYTEATILEVLRISSIVPLGTTHATTRNVKIGEYWIPKDTQIVPLLHAVHLDPNLWDEPQAFRPERFITAEGKVSKPEYFLPFGVGRRMCLGDVLARMEVFLFLSSLLHCYHLTVPDGEKLPSLTGITGVTLTPEKFSVSLEKRFLEDCDFEFLKSPSETFSTLMRNIGSH